MAVKGFQVDWAEFKAFVDSRGISIQWVEWRGKYWMKAFDGVFVLECVLKKIDPAPGGSDQEDFETNYQANGNAILEDRDEGGRKVVRSAATRKGWHYQAHSVSFEIGQKDSLYNKDCDGNDLGFSTITFYDDQGNDITNTTQLNIDTNAVKTVVKWCPTYDFEVISGSIRQISKKASDIYMYVNAKVATGLAAPNDWLKVAFVEGGINLNYIGADEPLKTDGRASKLFKGTNGDHFELIINHANLEKHKITVIFEIYKDPITN